MDSLLTIDQVAEYLGVSKLTLYGWISAKKITCIKVGGRVRFRREHLDKWIDQHTVKARSIGNASRNAA